MEPIQSMPVSAARAIRWVLTDIDDTLTLRGKLVPEAYSALWRLKEAGLSVIAVTGRAAAWGNLLMHEWPVDGVITENGAVAYYPGTGQHILSLPFPGAERNTAPALLRACSRVLKEIPRAKEAEDNYLRLYDLAIDYAENVQPPLSRAEVARIVEIFEEEGCRAQPSSIHVNTWIGEFNKKEASVLFLKTLKGYNDAKDRSAVLYAGDAKNDEVMFAWFPNACAVANIRLWASDMKHLPSWVSAQEYGKGFAEIADTLILKRNQQVL